MAVPLEAMTEGRPEPEQYASRDAAFNAWDAEQRYTTSREQAAFNAGWAARKAAQYAALKSES